jgi:hypothetical protein
MAANTLGCLEIGKVRFAISQFGFAGARATLNSIAPLPQQAARRPPRSRIR